MKFVRSIATVAFLVLAAVVLTPRKAYAYLDPGTGSFIVQLLIASVIGAFFTVKMWGKRILAFLMRIFAKKG